jgi:hypothetical protein
MRNTARKRRMFLWSLIHDNITTEPWHDERAEIREINIHDSGR